MMVLSTRIKLVLWALPLAGSLVAIGVAWIASNLLISPKRRQLQDYHLAFLKEPKKHGMRVESFETTHSGKPPTPCMLCEPTASGTSSSKGQLLRQQLTEMQVALPLKGAVLGTLVLVHGHSGRKEDHLPVAERFCAAGFRCLLLDVPGHGDHPARHTTFGLTESSLPKEVLEYAAETFGFSPCPAGLFGVSQGGAIVLQAAARNEDMWMAVAELSSFAELDQVVRHEARRFGPFAGPAANLMERIVEHQASYDPHEVRPIDAVAKLDTMPVLIGHGDADTFVTPDHADRLFAACPSTTKQFLKIPGASHGRVLVTNTPVYATLSRFFLEAMTDSPG